MAWILTTNRPFPSPPHTSNTCRTSGWTTRGRWGWRECDGRSAYGQTKICFLGIFCGHGTAGPGHPWPPNRPGSLPTRSGRLGGGERVGLRPWGCEGMMSALRNATINWRRAVGHGTARHGLPRPWHRRKACPTRPRAKGRAERAFWGAGGGRGRPRQQLWAAETR